MPRTAKAGKYDVTFVDVNLTKAQQAALKATEFSLDDLEAGLMKLTESGYKVTSSYDNYHSNFSAFLIPVKSDDLNAGMILTARGSSPIKALKQLLYKHFTVTKGAWLNFANPQREELDD